MCKTCGMAAKNLLSSCVCLSTLSVDKLRADSGYMDKSHTIHKLIPTNPQVNTQPKLPISPLFEHIFYPVSTGPTITTTR